MRKVFDVVKTEKGWEGKREGHSMHVTKGPTKKEVVAETIVHAKKHQPSSVRIHTITGGIQEERTYPRSSDPHRTKG